mmetsp:Transcript_42307/g.76734  ORF Transcript_42307/g.76734 Transcript_42307/m.76734 type:complete len:359 (-) Transcript_42307:185-1261(-)
MEMNSAGSAASIEENGPQPEGAQNTDDDVDNRANAATADDELNEDVRDMLDAKGCAGVLIDTWDKHENKIVQIIPELKKRIDFKPSQRRKVFSFYQAVIQELQLGDEAWHTAVWMLLRCLAARPDLDASPMTCMAVILLLRKNATALLPVSVDWYVHKAKILGEAQSRDAGGETGVTMADDIEVRDLLDREREVLNALGWKINLPSVYTWMSVLCTRAHILLKQHWGAQIGHAFHRAMQWCNAIMLCSETPLAPRCLANGLFCVGLAHCGVLPIDAVVPKTHMQYEMIFARAWATLQPPVCQVPADQVPMLVRIVEVAACRSIVQLQEDVTAVALVLQAVMHERDSWQQSQLARTGGA